MDDTIRLKTKQMAFVQNFFDKNFIKTSIGYVLPHELVPFQYKCDYTSIPNGQKLTKY